MTSASRIEGCLARHPVGWDRLAEAIGGVLSVDPANVRVFDVDRLIEPPPPVLVEIRERESGFRLDLTFYLRTGAAPEATGSELARRLAMALGQEVITSPPDGEDGAAPPDRWILATPDGSLYLARQLDPESDDIDIDRDPDQMTRLPGPEAPR